MTENDKEKLSPITILFFSNNIYLNKEKIILTIKMNKLALNKLIELNLKLILEGTVKVLNLMKILVI